MINTLEDCLLFGIKAGTNLTKTCTKCNVEYPATLEHFGKLKKVKSGLNSVCKICNRDYVNKYNMNVSPERKAAKAAFTRSWRKANPEKAKQQGVRRREQALKKIGFTIELFNNMLDFQDNKCILCGTDEPGGRGWCADHNHETGKARGVLCFSCNTTLGHIEAKPDDWMDKAKKYINEGGFYKKD